MAAACYCRTQPGSVNSAHCPTWCSVGNLKTGFNVHECLNILQFKRQSAFPAPLCFKNDLLLCDPVSYIPFFFFFKRKVQFNGEYLELLGYLMYRTDRG